MGEQPAPTPKGDAATYAALGVLCLLIGTLLAAAVDEDFGAPLGFVVIGLGSVLLSIAVIAWGVVLGLRMWDAQRNRAE